MKNKSVFLEVVVRRFATPQRVPLLPKPTLPSRRSRFSSARRSVPTTFFARAALILALVGVKAPTPSALAAVQEIGQIGLTVCDLNRELYFYTNTLPFRLISISELSGPDQDSLFGLQDTKLHVAMLQLGDEQITLTEHIGHAAKPIPPDSRSFDHWFQHIAIVVSDMDKAYNSLREHKVKHISTAPQMLPDWNKNAGGIKAFYFRDPEDHVLEIIWFPPGKGDLKWHSHRRENGRPEDVFLGIDHTAIVVSDTDKSLSFYRDSLRLRVAGESENYGVEQEHLNQVFGARLRITALRAPRGPGIEFLEYIAPLGGRSLPADASPRDLVFWTTHLFVDDLSSGRKSLAQAGGRIISSPKSPDTQIIRDPDGHALQLEKFKPQTTSAASALTTKGFSHR